MRVSVSLPSGNSLEFDVEQDCTLNDLRNRIQDTEGIPEDMQNFMALSSAKQGDWDEYTITELFAQDFDESTDTLKLKLILGPLNGGVGEIDCCFCGVSCFHQGSCFAWVN